jgi:DmsE family decaheme c-type cytochrome
MVLFIDPRDKEKFMTKKRGVVAAAFFAAAVSWGTAAMAQVPAQPVCMECHDRKDLGKVAVHHGDCASCHGGAEAHLSDPGRGTIAMPGSDSCLACHGRDTKTMQWDFADHRRAGVGCSDCHGIHAEKRPTHGNPALAMKDKASALCVSCHQSVLARFNMPSHHPVKEGAMSCLSCHDPHGSSQVSLTAKTAQCTSCHQSVRGPHMVEHPPAAEDCVSCHNPHGSPNRRLLQVAEPMLCLQCHSVAGNRHGLDGATNNTQRITGTALRKCTSCHSQVHGSSHDQHLRY